MTTSDCDTDKILCLDILPAGDLGLMVFYATVDNENCKTWAIQMKEISLKDMIGGEMSQVCELIRDEGKKAFEDIDKNMHVPESWFLDKFLRNIEVTMTKDFECIGILYENKEDEV